MSCYRPLDGYKTASGKVIVTARGEGVPRNSLTRIAMTIPCGRCIGCRLERSRQWALRCMHEAKLSRISSFVTLTYNDEFLPEGGTLVKRDLQLFMKRLRKAREPDEVRFFGCGEYGDDNGRPHYHLLLFNCFFPDRLYLRKNGRGENLYCSSELSALWPYGFNVIGDVTFESAAYVARYCLKKVNGDRAVSWYEFIDCDGVVHQRIPEFALMSRRPGIGATYYERFGSEVRAHDNVICNSKPVKPTRFYDTRTRKFDDQLADMIRRERKLSIDRADNTEERLRVKETIAVRSLDFKQRRL